MKLEALIENKELLMQEKLIFDDRFKEVIYENTMLQKKVEVLTSSIQGYENETE